MQLPPVIPFHKTEPANSSAAAPPLQTAAKDTPLKPAIVPAPASTDTAKTAPTPEPAKPDKPAPKAKTKTPSPPSAADASAQTSAKSGDEPAAASTEPALLPARPPLSDAAIVRTIERIGFACGEVVSSGKVADGGSDPSYRVNCSSGDSYRATNKNGRIFFRPWPGKSPKG
jgi:outer membrane biosynthesis protein TonB